MADYSYMSGGYKSYDNGYETHSPRWGNSGSGYNHESHRDHVCKPVIVDAQGRKRPIIAYNPLPNHHMNGTVTKTETVIEQVHLPHVRYGHSSPPKIGHAKDYGALNNGWNRPAGAYYDGPPEVDEFITKIQYEASRPSHTSPVSSTNWRQTANSNGGMNGYGGNYDHGSYGWSNPSGNTLRDPYHDGHQGKHHMGRDSSQEPVITSDGWERSSQLGWAAPPNKEMPLTRPTHDIGTAIEYMKDVTKHTPVSMAPEKPWLTVPTPMVPTISSSEAKRRYGNFSGSPQAVRAADTYSAAIDSREAVRRYGGQMM